jgi:hypothetical protein
MTRSDGVMEDWRIGVMEDWSNGVLEWWRRLGAGRAKLSLSRAFPRDTSYFGTLHFSQG